MPESVRALTSHPSILSHPPVAKVIDLFLLSETRHQNLEVIDKRKRMKGLALREIVGGRFAFYCTIIKHCAVHMIANH